MIGASIIWAAGHWAVPAVLIGFAFMALIVWAYASAPSAHRFRWVAAAFKALAVTLLLLCLLEPLISGVRPRPGANIFALLVDNSRSMEVGGRGVPSAEDLRQWFQVSNEGWQARLAQDFDVRVYAFDREASLVGDPTELDYDGDASNLAAALATLESRYRDRPLAGLLIFSDGNATDAPAALSSLNQPPCPVHAVWSPSVPPPYDIRLGALRVNQTHFETSPTTVTTDVISHGFEDQPLKVQLVDSLGKVIQEQSVRAAADGKPLPIRFRYRPSDGAIAFHRLKVLTATDDARLPDGREMNEATLENNQRTFLVKGGDGPFRILYVSGRPNWEFKYLRRALRDDDEIQLVGLLRIANKEPKFIYRDQQNLADTNRLFEGFSKDEDESERFDQPVFVRMGVQDSQELAEGFPGTAEMLFTYDAVILDDVEADFFSADQMLLLRRYVSQRGGGLLMLGGAGSFAEGGYDRTPLGDMLPVYLEADEPRRPQDDVVMKLTREGMLETWTRLRVTQDEEQTRFMRMPRFRTAHAVGSVKPGAIAVAQMLDGEEIRPAIATQRFGKGRTAALLIGDVWRWTMRRKSAEETDPAVFWRQTLRWLVADVPRRAHVDVIQGDAGQAIRLQVSVLNAEFQPDDNASVELKVTRPDGESLDLAAQPSDTAPGTYGVDYWPTARGGYHVQALVTTGEGETRTSASNGWVFAPDEREFERLDVNAALLSQLTTDSGGQAVRPDRLDNFVEELQRQPVPVIEQWVAPFWHQAWVFSLAIACLCAEWGLRRWKGLA